MQSLFTTIKEELQLPEKKINFFVSFIESIIQKKTINLDAIAEIINPENKKESNYRIIQRFFKDFNICFSYLAKFLMSNLPEGKKLIMIDRTQWKDINIFFLSVEYNGIAIPIIWNLLDKKGNTNVIEKKDLLEDYINLFGIESIDYLTADREFIGKEWFKWLVEIKIPFLIRIKSNFIVDNGISRTKVKNVFRYYAVKEKILSLFGIELKLTGKRITNKDLVIVATNNPDLFLSDYSNRWLIENMFACFKKKGFNLESTRMKDNYKVDKLICFVAIAYLWCILAGIHFKPKEKKKYIDKYPRKSIFKYGIETIAKSIFNKYSVPEKYQEVNSLFYSHNLNYKQFVVL